MYATRAGSEDERLSRVAVGVDGWTQRPSLTCEFQAKRGEDGRDPRLLREAAVTGDDDGGRGAARSPEQCAMSVGRLTMREAAREKARCRSHEQPGCGRGLANNSSVAQFGARLGDDGDGEARRGEARRLEKMQALCCTASFEAGHAQMAGVWNWL
ncbi:hypothetical protein L1887_60226 [Cichorium endivia]|nr:hypothetical protein L1887_60226 [Cichorium endivia]